MRKGQAPSDHMTPFEVMWSGCHFFDMEMRAWGEETTNWATICHMPADWRGIQTRNQRRMWSKDMRHVQKHWCKRTKDEREEEREKERHDVYCHHLLFILRSQSLQVQGKGDVSTPISSSWRRKGKTGPWFEVQGLSYCSGCVNNSHMLSYYRTSVGKGCPQMLFHGEIMES